MTFPTSPTEFFEQHPNPKDPVGLARAISELSRFRLYRAFRNLITVTAAYTIDAERDRVILADAAGGAFSVTLPAAENADATEYVIVRLNAGANAVTVVPGSGTINSTAAWGAANYGLAAQGNLVRVASDGSDYYVTGEHP